VEASETTHTYVCRRAVGTIFRQSGDATSVGRKGTRRFVYLEEESNVFNLLTTRMNSSHEDVPSIREGLPPGGDETAGSPDNLSVKPR
jgi:hypothetical protein